METVVIDPPVTSNGLYLYQEEGCYDLTDKWYVPGRALHVASAMDASYIPPLDNWTLFAEAVSHYDDVWMIYTVPLECYLQVPTEVRSKITIVKNPHAIPADLTRLGFKRVVSSSAFDLNVSERFWWLFDNQLATVQVADGCPYQCQFCPWHRHVFPYRRWADPRVSAELTQRANFPYLICPQITGNREWLAEFIRCLGFSSNPFWTDLNCAHLPAYEDDIRTLAQRGMTLAIVGMEFLVDECLRRIGCSHRVEQAKHMVRLLTELGVRGEYQLRYGHGETIEQIEETTDILLRLADELDISKKLHCLTTGPFYYWFPSDLSRSLKLTTVEPLGFPRLMEDVEKDRMDAWLTAYEKLRQAGWEVR